jgi:hypothetical protein
MAVIVQRHIDAEVSGVMFTPAAPDEPTASRPWMLSLMPLRSITLGIGSPEGGSVGKSVSVVLRMRSSVAARASTSGSDAPLRPIRTTWVAS